MAILGKIRSQGLILILVIALALFAFIIQGLLTSNGAAKASSLGSVGSTELDREAFARRVEATMQQRGAGTSTVQAVNSVWDAEVRDAVLNMQINEAGIEVSDEAVKNQVKSMYANAPIFLDENGQFSEIKMNTFVADLKNNQPERYQLWLQDVENAADQSKQTQFFNLLKSGIIGTQASGEMEYRLANDNRSFTFVNIPYTSIADSEVEISKSEISSYIAKNESKFKSEAQRDIQYVVFEDKASEADKAAMKSDMTKLLNSYEEFSENTNRTETYQGLNTVEDVETFVNSQSDLPYDGSYLLTSKLPATAKAIAALEEGSTYGPYEDGEYMKISRLEDKKTIMDSVQTKHILVAYAGATRSASTRSKEDAKKVADSIFATIGQSNSKFNAKWDYFNENTEVAKGEDIGWVVYSGNARNFAPGFTKFLFENDKGSVGISESSFGYHIINIQDTKAPTEAVKIATIAKKVEASKATGKQLFTDAQKFQQGAAEKDFTEVAKEFTLDVKPVKNLKAMDENLPGLQRNRSVVQWAFKEGTDIGDTERFETPEGYVIVQLTRKAEAGLMSAEEASATVTPILRNKKKAKMIMDQITATEVNDIASAQGLNARAATAVNRKSPTIPGVGEEPKVVGTAFGLAEGETSKPIAGEKGVFVVKVTAIENAPDLGSYKADANEVANRTANQATSKLVEALKKSIEITDNRSTFY
ncbi:peptidyl-prolyl cis-trans isomerase [Nonlabens ulvanivorans]|uniref:Periplasmic chaperone PpiD n=1 Tax=Nonlabens ulvanivorans TaxID=906888 RepID=A0A090Q879_NONUL|nr:peptidylprolyl isomerase [Nonlabens ulvanivorans]GAK99215.1 peptidyl-prolyl cis-trans isomerase [Nonlabens ulvanivorans]